VLQGVWRQCYEHGRQKEQCKECRAVVYVKHSRHKSYTRTAEAVFLMTWKA
jgi:hypothetical protein